MDIFMWPVAIASLIGTIANIKKKRWCFVVWFITNVLWAGYDVYLGTYSQAFLMVIYAGLAVWGWLSWKISQ